MNAQTFPTFDGTFVRTAPDNPDGSHNIAGYIFRFTGTAPSTRPGAWTV